MANLDFGFPFRSTLGFVTDAAVDCAVLAEAYPHTYTNGNGQTISAGWTDASNMGKTDIDSTHDVRLAGRSFYNVGGPATAVFQVNLASGDGGGAGTYTVRLAIGQSPDVGNAKCQFQLLDTSTVLIDGSAQVTPVDFIDASNTVRTRAAWPGSNAAVNLAFATTLLKLTVDTNAGGGLFTPVAYLRLTFVPAAVIPTVVMAPFIPA